MTNIIICITSGNNSYAEVDNTGNLNFRNTLLFKFQHHTNHTQAAFQGFG